MQEVAGTHAPDAQLLDKLLEGDWDPDAYDKLMDSAFDDDYYEVSRWRQPSPVATWGLLPGQAIALVGCSQSHIASHARAVSSYRPPPPGRLPSHPLTTRSHLPKQADEDPVDIFDRDAELSDEAREASPEGDDGLSALIKQRAGSGKGASASRGEAAEEGAPPLACDACCPLLLIGHGG